VSSFDLLILKEIALLGFITFYVNFIFNYDCVKDIDLEIIFFYFKGFSIFVKIGDDSSFKSVKSFILELM